VPPAADGTEADTHAGRPVQHLQLLCSAARRRASSRPVAPRCASSRNVYYPCYSEYTRNPSNVRCTRRITFLRTCRALPVHPVHVYRAMVL
jgi:hypothetical protein